MKKAFKVISGIIGGIVVYITVSAGVYLPFVVADAKKGYCDNCDYLMILGGVVYGEDTPSGPLIDRIECALEYLKENKSCYIVPCGGCFRPLQKSSEAQVIKDYLVERGIDENRFILEDKSTTTIENFKYAKKIIEEHSGKSINEVNVAFLSSDYHLHRAEVIANRCGIKTIGRVSCPTEENLIMNYVREYLVFYELLNPFKKYE